jgi:hypothetical protein
MKTLRLWFFGFGKSFSGGRNFTGMITSKFLGKSCLKINKKRYRFLDIKRRCYAEQKLIIVKIIRYFYKKCI